VLKKGNQWNFLKSSLSNPAKRWLLSFSSPPLGEITEREAGCENPFFNSLPRGLMVAAPSKRKLSLAIIGAGIGGLTAASALLRFGIEVRIFEQASGFARIGAGIQQTPNAIKVLRVLGLEERLRRIAFRPLTSLNREWDTGALTNEYPLGDEIERRFGAPHLLLHRGDLHDVLAAAVPSELIHPNHKLVGLEQNRTGVALFFANGARAHADAVVGADGIHSLVREIILGPEQPRFTGRVAYRTTYPASRLGDITVGDSTKWWGPDRHIVIYYVRPHREEIYFVTSTPEPDFDVESWSTKGDLDALREAYVGFHPHVRAVIEACPEVYKWALVERDPLPRWGDRRVVLLGDACHPMTPYMAQGAAMAVEDAAVLSRCLYRIDADGVVKAFQRYEQTRQPRTSRIQLTSRENTWMPERTEPDWVYGYYAWQVPLASPFVNGELDTQSRH
jgi:6-hydroxynicotinate 3-monooxygenase